MEIDYKHIYKSHGKHCSKAKNYKHGDGAKLRRYNLRNLRILNLDLHKNKIK
jgi:hypothetical protein